MCTYYVPDSQLTVLYFQFLIFTTVVQNYRGGEEDSEESDLVGLFSSSIHGFPLWTYLLGFSFFGRNFTVSSDPQAFLSGILVQLSMLS